jgi:RecA-family ATPase
MLRAVEAAGDVGEPPPPPPALWKDYLPLAALLASPPPVLQFVLPGLLGGTLGLLVSAGGLGKSMLALEVAASIAVGRDVFGVLGEAPARGRVIIVAAEDPPDILAHRLHALVKSLTPDEQGAFLQNVRIKSVLGQGWSLGTWSGQAFEPSSGLSVLADEIKEWRPSLVAIDTFNRCLAGMSENDNAVVGAVISEIEQVIAPTRTAALVLHHVAKGAALSGQGDAQQASRGASALTDNARLQLNLVGMSADEADARGIPADERRQWVRLVWAKSNYAAPRPDLWLRRLPGGVLGSDAPPDAVAPAPKERKGGARRKTGGDDVDARIPW